MLVVDEHPIYRVLLAQYDDLNLARIKRLRPGRQRRG
jgi:hypothetical protein